MTLAQLLTPELVVAEMQAAEHWPAITELLDHLVSVGRVPETEREALLEALRQREDKCTTGIGYGLAIPHVFSETLEEVVTVFGRSTEGIDFCALDGNPVNFIVLFIVPKASYNVHLRTLAAIARTLNNPSVRRRLAEADDADAILAALDSESAGA